MIRELLYLVGPPGVGKSTLARKLRTGWDTELLRTALVPHLRLIRPETGRLAGLELGVPRTQFPGTDALAMDIGPRALAFLLESPAPFVFAEGARLATRPFLGSLARQGAAVTVVELTAPQELLDARWRERGARQSPSWRKGAATRAQRVGEWAAGTPGVQLLRLDAAQLGPDDLAGAVRGAFPSIDPEVRQ